MTRPTPDSRALDERVSQMVRGWTPAVEEQLVERVGPARATRLTITYAGEFSDSYRTRTRPEEGAQDIMRLAALDDPDDRGVRLFRRDTDGPGQLRIKTYRRGGLIPLSDAVPVFENFGFRVLEEMPSAVGGGSLGYIHDFLLELRDETDTGSILARQAEIEAALSSVFSGEAEDDEFNQLVLYAGLDTQPVVWLRAWFRYLRQTGSSFGLVTVVDALRRAPKATLALVALFNALHDPAVRRGRLEQADKLRGKFDDALQSVRSIDDDRILRRLRALVEAILRTNAFAQKADEALAFKINSSLVPGLPRPVPWREIWVYSPRVEGIHLRGGPIARGGLRWSDRRDDFRTEILGLMKAQLVKNAVIVPTGAKGGFYPKQLPPPTNREAWLAEGTESYRIFIRSLLSITDNIIDDKVVHPDRVVIHDGEDPYFVVAADKGTATFSDVANAIARWNATSGWGTPSPAAARTATTTRRWASPPRARGFPSSATSSNWASTFKATRSRSRASATCRGTCSATACYCRRRLSSSRHSITATFSSTPIPIRPAVGRNATACSTCRGLVGTITIAPRCLRAAASIRARRSPSN